MATPLSFLVVDDNADSRFLLVKTLARKFPDAVVRECGDAPTAVRVARAEAPAAMIAHRAGDVDGVSLIRLLRDAAPATPLVMVSGIDRTHEARHAGATHFLPYDEWLRIGVVIQDLLRNPAPEPPRTAV